MNCHWLQRQTHQLLSAISASDDSLFSESISLGVSVVFLNGISFQQRIIDSYLLHLWQMHLRKSHGCFCFLFWFVLSQVSYTANRERPTWVLSAVFVTGYCQCGCCIGSHAERSEVDLHLPGIGNQCSLGCSSGQTQGTFSLDVNELASVSVFVCLAFNCFARNDRRHCLMT